MNQEVGAKLGTGVFDEYDYRLQFEPRCQREYNEDEGSESPVKYWQRLQSRYPRVSQLAIDALTMPASMFSNHGDLLVSA